MNRPSLFLFIIVLSIIVTPSAFFAKSADMISNENEFVVLSETGAPAGFMRVKSGKVIFLSKDDTVLKKIEADKWEIRNRENKYLGSLTYKDKYYKLYDSGGDFLGIITYRKEFRPRGAKIEKKLFYYNPGPNGPPKRKRLKKINNIGVKPNTVKLYLQILPFIKDIK